MRKELCGMIAGVLAAITLTSCGDNSNQCGEGTHEENGYCVGGGECGAGTVADPETGECLPDGTVICGDGTVYDPAAATCVPDDSVCGPGTVLVDGVCIDEGIVDVDAEEAAEPNDGDAAGEFAGEIIVPAIGADGFVIHGCVDPYRDVDGNGNPDSDFDYWILQTTGPTALHITADGVGGLAAGFVMQAGDDELFNDGWQRFGVNLVNDTSEREVFLPKAGIYIIGMTDSRSLFLDAAGGDDACYYTTISQIALPAATAGTINETPGTDTGNLRVITFSPATDYGVFDSLLLEGSDALFSSITAMDGSTYLGSSTEQNSIFGSFPAEIIAGGLEMGETLQVIIDPVYNYAVAPQPYTLFTTAVDAQALPTTGTDATITPSGSSVASNDAQNWLWFEATAAGQLVGFDMDFNGADANLLIVDSRNRLLAEVSNWDFSDPTVDGFSPEFVRVPAPGIYYVKVFREGELPADTWTLTNTLSLQSPTALVLGTPQVDVALPASTSAFYTFDPGTAEWVAFNAGATAGGGSVFVTIYDDAGFGWLDGVFTGAYPSVGQIEFDSDGTDIFEHIFRGDTTNYLFRISVTNPQATTTFDASATDLPFIDIGNVVPGTPVDRTGDPFVEDDVARYIASTPAGNELSITATPNTPATSDLVIDALDLDGQIVEHVDVGFGGDPETLQIGLNGLPFLPFRVFDYQLDAGTADLHVVSILPRPYTIAPGTLAYNDACTGTFTELLINQDDAVSSAQSLPGSFSAFEMFGAGVGTFVVSSNGFVSFGTAGSEPENAQIPAAAAPNALFAPFWQDLTGIRVCRKDTANTVTIQWTGRLYDDLAEIAQFQLVLHSDSVVDFIYGPGHTLDGSELDTFFAVDGATVGAENGTGTFGHQIFYNTASVNPGTSQTLTPE
jgi:hypothetical protein